MSIVFSLIGGLGFFLYGMKMMSDGLEKAAGAKMRRILEMFTKNRILGILVGTVFTAVIQSSSATTVMVVSFVNAGLMSLTNAAGVILGANIGTTVTSQLIAFNLSEVAPLFVMAGVIMLMFCKNNNIQKIGEVILGFGVLFVGLSTMSGAMSTLKDSPQIVEILGSLLYQLGALPVFTSCPPRKFDFYSTGAVSYASDVRKMILDDILGETQAIYTYEEMIRKLKDEKVSAIIARIVLDEKLHLETLKNILRELNKQE